MRRVVCPQGVTTLFATGDEVSNHCRPEVPDRASLLARGISTGLVVGRSDCGKQVVVIGMIDGKIAIPPTVLARPLKCSALPWEKTSPYLQAKAALLQRLAATR